MKIKQGPEQMLDRPMPGLLLSVCGQTIMSVMMYSLYSLADTFFVARGVGAYAAGAVSLVGPLMSITGAFASMVGAGGASLVSRALGRGDRDEAAGIVGNTFLLFYAVAVPFTVLALWKLEPIVRLLGAEDELLQDAMTYARIIVAGAVTSTGFSSLMRAEGNIRQSIYQWAIPSLLNLVLDPIFIFWLDMGVEGAALATVLSQVVSMSLSWWYFVFSGKSACGVCLKSFRPQPRLMGEVVAIGLPSLLSQICSSGYTTLVNRQLTTLGGAVTISAFGIIGRLKSFMFMPFGGIAQGLQPIFGFNFAAKRQDRVRQALGLTLGFTLVYGFVLLLVCQLLPGALMRIFISEGEVVARGADMLRIISITLPLTGLGNIAAVYYQATGKKRLAYFLPIASNLIISLPVLYGLSALRGLNGALAAFPVSDVLAFLLNGALLLYSVKKEKRSFSNGKHHQNQR